MRHRESGFTLLELFATLILSGAVAALGFTAITRAYDDSRRADDAARVVQEATRTLASLERDLREATAVEEAGEGFLHLAGPAGAVSWVVEGGLLLRDDGTNRVPCMTGVAGMEAARREGLVEVAIRYAPRYGGGTPPPLRVVAAPRAAGRPR